MEKNKYLGLCYFGEQIVRLIDSGATESVNDIRQKAQDKNLVAYVIDKYNFGFPISNYDIDAFEEFFCEYLLESRKSGVVNNGLLNMVCTILDKAELSTPNWSD